MRLEWLLLMPFMTGCGGAGKQEDRHVPTWSGEIAPIIYKSCTPCHRTGESGGFPLSSYRDVVKRKGLVRFVTKSRYMPPWPADPTYSHFAGERILDSAQITLIEKWVLGGTPRGDSLSEPAIPRFYSGSYFGKPDLVIRPAKPVRLYGNGSDQFMILKYPYELEKDTLADIVEFVPVQRKRVHHVNGHLLAYDPGRKFNYREGDMQSADERSSMMEIYRKMCIPYTDGKAPSFPTLLPNTVYYLPGYTPPRYPENIGGYRLPKNGVFLINNIHYGPGTEDLYDSSYINVFFRKSPVTRPVTETQMGTFGISAIEPAFVIPPGEVKTFKTKTTLSRDISVISVNPHMHLIGTAFVAFAVDPKGDTIPLIRIRKWDFRWQYYYTFRRPVKLEKGTTIFAFGTFDNRESNPNNPFHPPRVITQGSGAESMRTTEEMFQMMFTYMLYRPGDEHIELTTGK